MHINHLPKPNNYTKYQFYILLSLINIGILKIIDTASTKLALTIQHTQEGNPIISCLINFTNTNTALAMCLFINLCAIIIVFNLVKYIQNIQTLKYILITTIIINLLCATAVGNNIKLYVKHKSERSIQHDGHY